MSGNVKLKCLGNVHLEKAMELTREEPMAINDCEGPQTHGMG